MAGGALLRVESLAAIGLGGGVEGGASGLNREMAAGNSNCKQTGAECGESFHKHRENLLIVFAIPRMLSISSLARDEYASLKASFKTHLFRR